MAIVLDGTNGVTTPAESVTGTGVWSVGGSQIYKDASGNVGIGTSSPSKGLQIQSSLAEDWRTLRVAYDGTYYADIAQTGASGLYYRAFGGLNHVWESGGTERMRIDSSGNFLVGTTALPTTTRSLGSGLRQSGIGGLSIRQANSVSDWAVNVNSGSIVNFYSDNGSSLVYSGQITVNGNTTAYTSASDYRLKENINPMVGALDKVSLLKPVIYSWKANGELTQGFIAHELQAVIPECVYGEKDAVDAEGKPKYQGIDTSFLVATLTAAIQELKAIIDTQATRITALEAK